MHTDTRYRLRLWHVAPHFWKRCRLPMSIGKAVERGIIPELRAAIDAHGHRASKSVLTGAQATLQQLEADDALRFGGSTDMNMKSPRRSRLAGACKCQAVAQTIARLHELRAGTLRYPTLKISSPKAVIFPL